MGTIFVNQMLVDDITFSVINVLFVNEYINIIIIIVNIINSFKIFFINCPFKWYNYIGDIMFNKIYENIKNFILSNFSFLIFLILILIVTFVKLPYQVEMPGGTIDLSNRVIINGEKVEIDGTFSMAYVSVVQGSIPYLLLGMVIPDWDIVKSSDVTYEGETIEDSNKRDKLYLEQSKDYAIVTAMDAAGLDYEITDRINYVAYISTEADTTLKIGDDIISCDGTEVMDIQSVKSIINSKNAGDEISFVVLRDGKEVPVRRCPRCGKDAA